MEGIRRCQAAINCLLVLAACVFFALALKYSPDDVTPYLYAGGAAYIILLAIELYLEKKS